jgi:hypothetical protein
MHPVSFTSVYYVSGQPAESHYVRDIQTWSESLPPLPPPRPLPLPSPSIPGGPRPLLCPLNENNNEVCRYMFQTSLQHLTALVTYKLGLQVTPSPSPATTTPTLTSPPEVAPTPPQPALDPNTPLLLPERPLEPWEPHPLNWYTEAPDSALRKACFIRVGVTQVIVASPR